MARYNTVVNASSVSGSTSIASPDVGLLTTITGSSGVTITLASPSLFTNRTQSFYNTTGGSVTLSTPTGAFNGPQAGGGASIVLPNAALFTFISDGVNYILVSNQGGPQSGTTATFTGALTVNPSNANVSIAPSGTGVLTLNSGAPGSLNNISIGETTPSTGKFTTLQATTSATLSPTGTVTVNPSSTGTINNTAIGASTPQAGTFTSLVVNTSASGNGFSTIFASPPALGSGTANTAVFSSLSVSGTTSLQQLTEVTVDTASPGASVSRSFTSGTTFYVTGMTANFTLNLTGVPTTASRTIVVTMFLIQGATPYYCNTFQIDGAGQTIKWPGGSTPTVVANRTDIQTFTLIRTSGGAWVVLSQLSSFA